MDFLKSLMVALAIGLMSCSTLNFGGTPTKSDFVDPKVQDLVNEYKELAQIMGINFQENVGISFIRMEEPYVIGLCHYAFGYRQIELDGPFFSQADANQRLALVFHELTHCYCTRSHDYKDGKYPESKAEQEEEWKYRTEHGGDRPGYFPDGCPVSIMAPIVVESYCVQSHYATYVTEMFDRCRAF